MEMYCGQKIQKCADNNVPSHLQCNSHIYDLSIASHSNNIYSTQIIIAWLFTEPLLSDLFTATAVCSHDPRTLFMINVILLVIY